MRFFAEPRDYCSRCSRWVCFCIFAMLSFCLVSRIPVNSLAYLAHYRPDGGRCHARARPQSDPALLQSYPRFVAMVRDPASPRRHHRIHQWKSGTTWIQRIVSVLIHGEHLPGELSEISPWIDARFSRSRSSGGNRLGAQTFRRAMKAHLPFDALPYNREVKYICVVATGEMWRCRRTIIWSASLIRRLR